VGETLSESPRSLAVTQYLVQHRNQPQINEVSTLPTPIPVRRIKRRRKISIWRRGRPGLDQLQARLISNCPFALCLLLLCCSPLSSIASIFSSLSLPLLQTFCPHSHPILHTRATFEAGREFLQELIPILPTRTPSLQLSKWGMQWSWTLQEP
jgi:hypothetical protein